MSTVCAGRARSRPGPSVRASGKQTRRREHRKGAANQSADLRASESACGWACSLSGVVDLVEGQPEQASALRHSSCHASKLPTTRPSLKVKVISHHRTHTEISLSTKRIGYSSARLTCPPLRKLINTTAACAPPSVPTHAPLPTFVPSVCRHPYSSL